MKLSLSKFFRFEKHNTNLKKELLGGLITFITMMYLIPTVASMISQTGVSYDGAFIVLAIISAFSTIILSVSVNVPFVMACGLGVTSYIIYTVVIKLGFNYSEALVMMFISNVLFMLLSIFKVRFKIIDAIPKGVKNFISSSLGAFLMIVGIASTGIVSFKDTFIYEFNEINITVILGLIGVVIALVLFLIKKTRNIAIISSVGVMTIISIVLSICKVDGAPGFSWDFPSFNTVFDVCGLFFKGFSVLGDFRCYPLILIILIMNLLESTASIYALAGSLNRLDDSGHIKGSSIMGVVDSSCCVMGSVVGLPPVCVLCESEAGMNSGAQTGFSGHFTAILIFLMIFIYPVFSIFAPVSGMLPITSGATFLIGLQIFLNIKNVDKKDIPLIISGILMIISTVLSYSLSIGIGIGLLVYSILTLVFGKAKEVGITTYIITIIFTIGLVVQQVFF